MGELVLNQEADTNSSCGCRRSRSQERNESCRREQDLPFSRSCYYIEMGVMENHGHVDLVQYSLHSFSL